MPVDLTQSLRRALTELHAERRLLERQIVAVSAALKSLNGASSGSANGLAPAVERRGQATRRRRLSPAARRAVSARMKAYWAKRRADAARGRAKKTRGPKR